MSERDLETAGEKDFGPCDCCAKMSRSIWGYLHEGGSPEAAYFVQWTLGGVSQHGAHFDFIVGRWGEGATSADRAAVSLAFRRTESGPQFMVIDAQERPVSRSELISRSLKREEVIGTPIAAQVFAMVDHLWLHEGRIAEITGGPTNG